MPLAIFALVLILSWAIIHAVYYLIKPAKTRSILPFHTRYDTPNVWKAHTTQVTVKYLHLRIQTTAWNLPHDLLIISLKRKHMLSLAETLKYFYDLGSILGVIGMLVALFLLSLTGGMTASSLAHKLWAANNPIPSSETIGGLAKRGLNALETRAVRDSPWIKPIIPGVTVPMTHFPVMLITMLLAQVVHEFGHAITAAIEYIPILAAGVSLTLVIPSAFVTLPAAALEALAPRARARIIAAGPFHNILFWCTLFVISYIGMGDILCSVGYKDMSALGKVVVGVNADSPIHGYLPSGSLITMLDDTSLGSTGSSGDPWVSYLTDSGPEYQKEGLGWCAEHLGGEELCCLNQTSPGLACFVSTDMPTKRGCLDPIPILTSGENSRCNALIGCSGTSICVKPDRIERLLRLTVHRPSSHGGANIVLWSGPLEEVWEEVQVGTLLPRIQLLPISLPAHAKSFWEYLMMGTLSLFFFNLLPLPYLDGAQFLTAILQMLFDRIINRASEEYDLEVSGIPEIRRRRVRCLTWWKRMLDHFIPRMTICLFALCMLLEVINVSW